MARNGAFDKSMLLKLLLATGKADVESNDPKDGRTLLSWAAESDHNVLS